MANKKAPLAWRQRGRNEAGGKQFARSHSAGTDREAQGHTCADCAFYREIPLPSGRRRRLCALTGEKLRSSAKCCENFRPGKWAERGAAFYPVRQGLVCRACSSGLVPTIRAALLGLVGCMAGHVIAGAAWPAFCADFRARGAADVR